MAIPLAEDIRTDLGHMMLAVGFEIRKHLRRKRILIVVILAILLPLIFYVIPPIFDIEYSDSAAEFVNSNLAFIDILIIISGAIFAGDVISSEFETKTGLLLFPTPQRRTSIFVGKYIATLLMLFSVVSMYYLMTIIEVSQIYGAATLSQEMAQSFLLALIYSTSVVSIIYFFSAIFKRTIISSIFGFFFLMMILPIISVVLQVADVEPWFIVTYPAGLITSVLGVQSGFGMDHGPGADEGGGFTSFEPDFQDGVAVMVGYTVILFLMALFIANRKRME